MTNRKSCCTCKHLYTQAKYDCSSAVEHKCLKGMIDGWFSPAHAIANKWKGQCPTYENKNNHPEEPKIHIRKPRFEVEVCLL